MVCTGKRKSAAKRPAEIIFVIRRYSPTVSGAYAVVQDLEDYEKNREELAFVKAVAQGLMDIKQGKTLSLSDVKKGLGIK